MSKSTARSGARDQSKGKTETQVSLGGSGVVEQKPSNILLKENESASTLKNKLCIAGALFSPAPKRGNANGISESFYQRPPNGAVLIA